MRVNITYFGLLVEVSGEKAESIQLESGSISSLLDELYQRKPALSGKIFAVFRNNEIVNDHSQGLQHNDEVCLMPPFSGG